MQFLIETCAVDAHNVAAPAIAALHLTGRTRVEIFLDYYDGTVSLLTRRRHRSWRFRLVVDGKPRNLTRGRYADRCPRYWGAPECIVQALPPKHRLAARRFMESFRIT